MWRMICGSKAIETHVVMHQTSSFESCSPQKPKSQQQQRQQLLKSKPSKRQQRQRQQQQQQQINLKHSPTVDIPVRTIIAVAHKANVYQNLGFSLKRSESGVFTVGAILPTSPLRDTLLRPGMIVTSVNGLIITGRDLDVALSTILDATGPIILGAETNPRMLPPSSTSSSSSCHPSEPKLIRQRIVVQGSIQSSKGGSSFLGMSLLKVPITIRNAMAIHNNNKTLFMSSSSANVTDFVNVVSRISPNSPFANTELEIGMEIKTINGMDVSKTDVRDVLRMLKECHGKTIIVAERDIPIQKTEQQQQQEQQEQQQNLQARTTKTAVSTSSSATESLTTSYRSNSLRTSYQSGLDSLEDIYPIRTRDDEVVTRYMARAIKRSHDQILGVMLQDDYVPGSFIVTHIAKNSPFRETTLQVGDEVVGINGVSLDGLDMVYVSQLLRGIVGPVNLECVPQSEIASNLSPLDGDSSIGWC